MTDFSTLAWNVDEPTYRADEALSYSTLANYERNGRFSALPTLFDKISTPSLTFGSMVDTLLTGSEEEFNSLFIIVEDSGLSDTLKEITVNLYNLYKDTRLRFEDIPDEVIAQVGKDANYYAGDNYAATRVKKIKESCKPYYSMLCLAEGKKIVSQTDVEDARRCAEVLKTNPRTSFYFAENDPFDTAVKRYYQLKFKVDSEEGSYRCMADVIIVDYEHKTIQPCDLKTSSHNEWEFPKSFQQWRYDIQARLYWRLIKEVVSGDPFFREFTVLPYKFIVINKKNLKPMVWDFEDTVKYGLLTITTPSGYTMTWRDPFVIGKELKKYLDSNPELPMEQVTEISTWLKTN